MTASIMQTEKKCYVSGSKHNLDCHHQHVMGGTANRKISDKYGIWCWLRHDIHMDLHDRNKDLEIRLKQDAQRAFEKIYSREKWMSLFYKNYL